MFNTREAINSNSFNNSDKASKSLSIIDLFRLQVEMQPENIAVMYHDKTISYNEIADDINALAIYLQKLKVKTDDCIGLYLDPSIDLIIAVWGVLVAGAAYLPLSPEYPIERLQYMLEDSDAKIIITQTHLKQQCQLLTAKNTIIITLDEMKDFLQTKQPDEFENLDYIKPHHLAYVIYTSGTTGKPKGVMIEHHSISNQMTWLKNKMAINRNTVILQKTPISFDAAQWEILSLCCGACVVMSNSGSYKNPPELIELIQKYNVNTLQCVPTLLQALLDDENFQYCQSLTHLFSGGEPLSKKLASCLLKTRPDCRLVNLYGPTECTINSSAYEVDKENIMNMPSTISIGKPIDNLKYIILNEQLEMVATGETGELYISGAGLARGYLNQSQMTADKFINYRQDAAIKLYKTGDIVKLDESGNYQYISRLDNQIKLRGYRIELDEISSAISIHEWIRRAAVIVKEDKHTGYQSLIAFIELDSKEAALMDQGNHDTHHQSKQSKAQVKLQLANKGCRDNNSLMQYRIVNLASKISSEAQEKKVFARKTYRYYEGSFVYKQNILDLLATKVTKNKCKQLDGYAIAEFGEMIRYFGQFISEKRLLPKYAYSSPGALYATQMYFELNNCFDLESGYYYYHPVFHQLYLINRKKKTNETSIKIYFIGKKSAIEPIYKNNIQEVLEMEAGHMVGLFEQILPEYGLSIELRKYDPQQKSNLNVADEDYYLGCYELIPGHNNIVDNGVDLYVQIHSGKVADMDTGLYQYENNELIKVSDQVIERRHVIAINQEVYNRASFGICIISHNKNARDAYINLGRKLQHLQMNDLNIGLMSSGYSSKTGNDLLTAKRIKEILGVWANPSYFSIGGKVSDEQIADRGMREDAVHVRGPAEMVKDDLKRFLPVFMLPNKVVVVDKIPLTSNGKIDTKSLHKINIDISQHEFVAPKTQLEAKLVKIWKRCLKAKQISITDNFFDMGGNSLIAVHLIEMVNRELNASLPLQDIFENSTIELQANKIQHEEANRSSRLIKLQNKGTKHPVYCWPGLGGYCMNLRLLAQNMENIRPFYGIQSYGINLEEIAYDSIDRMALEDIKLIKQVQATGPYTLWGYSFGARVAFEVAYQLEQKGEKVDGLFLIAPGTPALNKEINLDLIRQACFKDKTFLTIIFSVFMGSITDSRLSLCFEQVNDRESFKNFILFHKKELDEGLVTRIINIVSMTYGFGYTMSELKQRVIKAPIIIFSADGDSESFIENYAKLASMPNVTHHRLTVDHYNILRDSGIGVLMNAVRHELNNFSDADLSNLYKIINDAVNI